MEIIFVIQDVNTKEYYWRYRIDDGFDSELDDATTFDSENEAIGIICDEYLIDLFEGRTLEIKKYIKK